ncbi:MAG TPA: restriction endonuclease subunit S [Hyphomonadaceae bacterium]|nr:restriction endonuclease subunit S [Hyphomonadaceae bacterium]
MSEWASKTLGDLITLQRGFDITKSKQNAGQYPVISSGGIASYHDAFMAEGPGVVIGRKGTLGTAFYVEGSYWPHDTTLWVKDFKGNDARFIYYLLKSISLERLDSGSANPTLNRNYAHLIQTTAPVPAVQQKIAAVLSALDAKIDLNNRINAELEALAETIYDYWFVQFDFPDAEGLPYKTNGGKMVWNDALKREIPAGWEVGPLGRWLTFKRGISYRSAEICGEGTPLINLNSFRLDGSVKLEGTKQFSGKFRDDQRVAPGDLVIAITDVTRNAAIIGKAFVVPDLFGESPLISCDVASVFGGGALPAYYLERLFNSSEYHSYIRYFASGTLVLHLNLDGMQWFETFAPPQPLLGQYCDIVESARKMITANHTQNRELTQLRDWLLPLLMNGQVSVA